MARAAGCGCARKREAGVQVKVWPAARYASGCGLLLVASNGRVPSGLVELPAVFDGGLDLPASLGLEVGVKLLRDTRRPGEEKWRGAGVTQEAAVGSTAVQPSRMCEREKVSRASVCERRTNLHADVAVAVCVEAVEHLFQSAPHYRAACE